MSYSNIEQLIRILKLYSSFEDKSLYKQLTPIVAICFATLFSCLLITDGYYFILFILVGVVLGSFLSYNHDSSKQRVQFKYERNLTYTVEQFNDSPKEVELFYPPLTIVVNQLLDYVMRDFILSWWKNINIHKDKTFENLARERLNVVFLNVQKILLNQERNDIVMSTLYGVANTLIIHMRECRAFEDSQLSIDQYVLENPQSPFGQLFSKEEQHRQLRGLSQTFLKRTLPAQDRDSFLLMSLFRELLATFLFGGVLDSLSDPDFLNCWIIDLLSDKEKAAVFKSTLSDAVLLENLQDLDQRQQEDDSSTTTSSSFEHISPPCTPTTKNNRPEPISTKQQQPETTLLASLQSPPPPPSPLDSHSMIFSRGSVNFTIMDISAPQPLDQPLNTSALVYIIQIERPAMEDDHAGSEGGGYVITRTYADFETFHTILSARHTKRISKLQLKLPLATFGKTWLKSQQKKKTQLSRVSSELEKYIDTVVQDEDLGTDNIILPFLRKERRSEIDDVGMMVPFAEEYKEAAAQLTSSKFPRQSSQASFKPEKSSIVLDEEPHTSRSSMDSKKQHPSILAEDQPPVLVEEPKLSIKSLSSMDVELLIETTYALVVEIFNLTPTNNKAWMRRSILNLLREIVRRSYAEFISEQYTDFVNKYMSPDAIVAILNRFGENFWPEGKWILDQEKKVVRTEEDKKESEKMARDMLINELIPNAMRQLIGDQNCNLAMDRIWARIQDPDLNRVLIIQVLERIVKPILG